MRHFCTWSKVVSGEHTEDGKNVMTKKVNDGFASSRSAFLEG